MPRLSVNIDHVATIREARGTVEPDPLEAGLIVQKCGADGVTVHLRHDRRHIQDKDVWNLRKNLKIKLNLEMAATKEMLNFATKVKPDLVTLVPEKKKELTTEGGLDVASRKNALVLFIKKLKKKGITVSIFVNPDEGQIGAAKEVGADFVEIHTGVYAEKFLEKLCDKSHRYKMDIRREIGRIKKAVRFAKKLGLRVNAGHGLTCENVAPIAKISGIEEMSIGHSLISRAIFVGLGQAVKEIMQRVRVGVKK